MTDQHPTEHPSTDQPIIDTVNAQFKSLSDDLQKMVTNTKQLQESLKGLHKTCKSAEKQSKKKNTVQSKNTLSKDLEKFLSVDHGTQLTKAEVMKGVSKYIKDKHLQLEENKRQFKADKAMHKIFGMDVKKPLTFVEIGGHISGHLTKV